MASSDFRAHRPSVSGTRHMVAAGHYLAAHVGFLVLEAGGNAVDAGVATGIAEGVVESHFHAFSGVSPILVYQAETGEVATVDGVGTWPKAASCQYFHDRFAGKIPHGDQSAIVPAPPDAWITALRRWGTMSFAEVAARAIAFARDGFPMYPHMKMLIEDRIDLIREWPGNSAVYLPDGRVPAVGALFRQPALAATLQHMADEEQAAAARGGRDAGLRAARDAFYKGDIARAFAAYMTEHDGLLTYDDMADYEATVEPALKSRYRDFELHGCGPWTGAPILLQALGMLEGLDLEGMGHNSAAYIHALVEAIKIAAADRHGYYGDPRFVDVPIEALLAPAYAAERRRLIDPARALPDMPAPGRIEGVAWPATAPGLDGAPADTRERARAGALATTFFCVVDSDSNVFASTPSSGAVNAPIVPALGLPVSVFGVHSSTEPDHPHSVAPGKRPNCGCMPTLAIRPGRDLMPFGSPGSGVIPQAMMQVFFNINLFGMAPQEAVEAPRFASYSFPAGETRETHPGLLRLEPPIAQETADALSGLGHRVEWFEERHWLVGSVSAIHKNLETGVVSGGADPRRQAYAVGL